jgi:hypothetical protein
LGIKEEDLQSFRPLIKRHHSLSQGVEEFRGINTLTADN